MSIRPDTAAIVELVRLPAVLSIPGDVLVGAAAADRFEPRRIAGTVASSSCLYLGGMALNDWADRHRDARERPHRPIPSGRVTPGFAFGTAAALTGLGVALAGLTGGRDSLAVAVPLAATAWSYDLVAKDTPVGPLAMAAARTLNVLAGAGRAGARDALPEAATVGAHTAVITIVSRHEVEGSGPELGRAAAAAVAGVAGVTAVRGGRRRLGAAGWLVLLGGLFGYLADLLRAARDIVADPVPEALQGFVARGIRAFPVLDAALLAVRGRLGAALGLVGMRPVAERLSREVSTT